MYTNPFGCFPGAFSAVFRLHIHDYGLHSDAQKNAKNDQFVLSARKITLKNLPHPDDDGGTRGLGAAKQSQKKG